MNKNFWWGYIAGCLIVSIILISMGSTSDTNTYGKQEKVCISYSVTDGKCVTDTTVQDLIDNARKAEKK